MNTSFSAGLILLLWGIALGPVFFSESDPAEPLFLEAAEETGLRFRHFTGATGEYFMPEIMGSGVAVLDFDGDGDLDVFLIQGSLLDTTRTPAEGLFPPAGMEAPSHRLFRNEWAQTGRLHFTDVTREAGLERVSYGMGVAVGDYTNNGFPDFYLTEFGSNVLYRNNGDGTFTDVTESAGVDDPRWSASAAFFDFDRDGHLDLYVTNYLNFTVAGNKRCTGPTGELDYCSPAAYQGLPDRLFRNLGDGRFADVTLTSGVGRIPGPGLGVVAADLNGNGWPDLYVANDGAANFLWVNQGDGTFVENALLAGVAYSGDGLPQAGMGVSAGDFDNDGDEDLVVTNLTREGSTLYRNNGRAEFYDATREFGLAAPSFLFTGFGIHWFDLDNSGWLDLFAVNGAVTIIPALRGTAYPFHQINQLFRNEGPAIGFREINRLGGPALQLSEVSRGAAFGDLNNNGKIDIVVSNNNGPARLLLNQQAGSHHWLTVGLAGTEDNRMGLGARVAVVRRNGDRIWRRAHADGSYLSASDPRVHFGLGQDPEILGVEVHWLKGPPERWEGLQTNHFHTLKQGTGSSIQEPSN